MKCSERRGGKTVLESRQPTPLFPLLYEIAAMDKNGKQFLHFVGRTVPHG
jgi:hypothetical protein